MSPNELVSYLAQTLELTHHGKRREASSRLRILYEEVKKNPFLLWDDIEVVNLGKACFLIYHFDLFDDEKKNIECVHLSYLFLHRATELFELAKETSEKAILFEALKYQALLLKLSRDSYISSVATFYQPHNRTVLPDEIKGSELLAERVLTYVLYDVLVEIDDTFKGFLKDQFLEDVCREIELEFPHISEKLMKEAANVRRLLFIFIKGKVMNQDFIF